MWRLALSVPAPGGGFVTDNDAVGGGDTRFVQLRQWHVLVVSALYCR